MPEPALLLVHGYPFDHTLWERVIPLLNQRGDQRVHVLAPDLRGFGGKATGSDPPALDLMAADLKELLDRARIDRAVVAGMSMGGYVALAFAERHASRLAGLALISSQPWADSEEARAGRRSMIQKVRREGPHCAAEAAIPKLFARQNASRSDLLAYPARGAERAGVEGIAWALEAMARRPDRTEVLKRMQVPVLVLHGTEDQFIAPERAREAAALAPNGRFVQVEGAGHATPLEAPEAVAEALLDLVRQIYGNHFR